MRPDPRWQAVRFVGVEAWGTGKGRIRFLTLPRQSKMQAGF
jgi:hypothetical protein